MAACGFLIGWQKICFAFLAGCILGSVIHSIRMKRSGADHVLAMGPYLSLGVFLALFLCDPFVEWYISLLV
jgi:leader peptidase (prepilin peptidase)/N-methyltransferase